MAKTYDYNPVNGNWYEIEDNLQNPGELFIHTKADSQAVIDRAKKLRNNNVNDKVGEFNHYAIISPGLELELKNKGIDIYDKNNTAKIVKEIEQNYPKFKVSNLRHSVSES
jgi:hypothetical protein